MKKRTLLVSVILMMTLLSQTIFAGQNVTINGNNNIFIDVHSDHWAHNEIEYFAKQGILNGVGDNMFEPEDTVTREEFAKMLVLTYSVPTPQLTESPFSDVALARWSLPYIDICKTFMTMYRNPFGGKPSFHPEENATREDIAVAIVKMLGVTVKDYSNKWNNYRFADDSDIATDLKNYIYTAYELGILKGYNDGTFRPNRAVSRAETVVLLNRATKTTYSDYVSELSVYAEIKTTDKAGTYVLEVKVDDGVSVTVDGAALKMTSNWNGASTGKLTYVFPNEGSKTFKIVATKGMKTTTIERSITYKNYVPVISITSCPETTTVGSITVTGKVTDEKDTKPTLTINDKSVTVNSDGTFSKVITLKEGENVLNFVAKNNLGTKAYVTKKVVFSINGPVISFNSFNEVVTNAAITLSGKVSDMNDKYPTLYFNKHYVVLNSQNEWSITTNLKEGVNVLTFVAYDKYGKTSTVEKKITYTISAPVISLSAIPEVTNLDKITITGTAIDANDPTLVINASSTPASVTVNSLTVTTNGAFTFVVNLVEGDNKLTFTALNDLGKLTTVEKTIRFVPLQPTLTVGATPVQTTASAITLTGSAIDLLDSNLTVKISYQVLNSKNTVITVTSQALTLASNGEWSFEVPLVVGENVISVQVVNKYNKSTVVTKTIQKPN